MTLTMILIRYSSDGTRNIFNDTHETPNVTFVTFIKTFGSWIVENIGVPVKTAKQANWQTFSYQDLHVDEDNLKWASDHLATKEYLHL